MILPVNGRQPALFSECPNPAFAPPLQVVLLVAVELRHNIRQRQHMTGVNLSHALQGRRARIDSDPRWRRFPLSRGLHGISVPGVWRAERGRAG